jgi:hypothetical protein
MELLSQTNHCFFALPALKYEADHCSAGKDAEMEDLT